MYNGYSQNQMRMNKNNQHNINNAFNPGMTLIPHQQYINPDSLSHNNVPENFFNENLMDYTIHIDSADRDASSYPIPYKFTVSLGGAGTSRERTYDPKSGMFVTTYYSGVPNPRIEKNFINIKNVILDKVFMPKFIIYTRSISEGVTTYTGSVTTSSYYRYLALRIKELDNNKIYSTNNNIRDDSFVIYKDKELGGVAGEIWIASPCRRQYFKSILKNLDRLTIELVDRNGNQVVPLYIDDSTDPATYVPIPNVDLTKDLFQFTIHFTLQCFENDINTNVNYR
jgi:hypothetical protein